MSGISHCLAIFLLSAFLAGAAPVQHQFPLHEQTRAEPGFSLEATGFVRWDGFFNTRQSVNVREGLLYFYPAPVKRNAAGIDENADPQINFLSVFTRGALRINAPEVLGAKLSGLIEADFFGHLNPTISNLRLRHAYTRLTWDGIELMIGQYWNLFSRIELFPGVLNPGAGQPLQPFSRNPGIYALWNPLPTLRLSAAATMQRDAFSEFGALNELQQRSGVPALNLDAAWVTPEFQAGFGLLGKAVRPEPGGANLFSGAGQIYAGWQPLEQLRLRGRFVLGQDLADHQMLGGIVKSDKGWLNLVTLASWLDLEYKIAPQWRVGLFGGYTSNLGTLGPTGTTSDPKDFIARNPEQAWSVFVVPRLIFDPSEHLRFALELNWTSSLYASAWSPTLAPAPGASDAPVQNLHVALTSMLLF